MVTESTLVVALFSRVSISLELHFCAAAAALKRRRPVRMVFLECDKRAGFVEFDARGAKVVLRLVPLQWNRVGNRVSVLDRLRLHERDPLLVVEDVQRLPFELDRDPIPVVLAVNLESTEIQALFLSRAVLRVDDFAHALPGAVVDVVCSPASAE